MIMNVWRMNYVIYMMSFVKVLDTLQQEEINRGPKLNFKKISFDLQL